MNIDKGERPKCPSGARRSTCSPSGEINGTSWESYTWWTTIVCLAMPLRTFALIHSTYTTRTSQQLDTSLVNRQRIWNETEKKRYPRSSSPVAVKTPLTALLLPANPHRQHVCGTRCSRTARRPRQARRLLRHQHWRDTSRTGQDGAL